MTFDEWWITTRKRDHMSRRSRISVARKAWLARQPEIDELKAEVERLEAEIGRLMVALEQLTKSRKEVEDLRVKAAWQKGYKAGKPGRPPFGGGRSR